MPYRITCCSTLCCEGKVTVLTTFLDLAGIVLLIAAAYVFAGAGLALAAAGAASLALSWRLTR